MRTFLSFSCFVHDSLALAVQFSSVAQSCPTLCDPMNRSTPGLPVHYQLSESIPKPMSIELVMPSNHLILCRPLLLLPPIPPNIRVFSNESTLPMRWPKYWSFSFSIIPSKETPGLAWGWCTGMTQRDGMGRKVGGGFRFGNTCIPMMDSC